MSTDYIDIQMQPSGNLLVSQSISDVLTTWELPTVNTLSSFYQALGNFFSSVQYSGNVIGATVANTSEYRLESGMNARFTDASEYRITEDGITRIV